MGNNVPVGIDPTGHLPTEARQAIANDAVNEATELGAKLAAGLLKQSGDYSINPDAAPFLQIANEGSQSSLHLPQGAGITGPYLIGIGNDNESSPGILVANKASGIGVKIHQQSTIAAATAYGLNVIQESTVASGGEDRAEHFGSC